MRVIAVIVFSILLSKSTLAQKNEVGNWFIYVGNQKINKNWNLHSEIQYRNYNFIGDMNQLLLRTGIGYNLTENNNNVLLGYGFINTQNYLPNSDDKIGINEHRIFQQFSMRHHFNRVFMQHRYRMEERFLPTNFKLRYRYSLALNIPLNKNAVEKHAIYLSAYNEIFINSEKPLFDRNRQYGALGYVLNKNIKIELGYMLQTLENTKRNQFQIAVFNNLPFNKN